MSNDWGAEDGIFSSRLHQLMLCLLDVLPTTFSVQPSRSDTSRLKVDSFVRGCISSCNILQNILAFWEQKHVFGEIMVLQAVGSDTG